ncbi:dermonecrotic toxin domain-containing protein [Luteibacter sp. NPDC031894]|uniref:dermonecrotic toxin domain-containing protein n=1 Tax=Luteibacter sp. NPDC031894 TaxID=3390572 RepID=UPI003CFF69E8
MHSKNLRTRLAVATTLFLTTPLWPAAEAVASTTAAPRTASDDPLSLIAAPDDRTALQGMLATAHALPAPDARAVARAFISERLGVDGDAYVVAHFATAADRALGAPDHTVSLTDALLEAFPGHARHTFFAELADGVGGISAGGAESASIPAVAEAAAKSKDAGAFFRTMGRFLWSRTGPGYLYNTFFADGSVIATVGEDQRALDEAFGIYRAGGFGDTHASAFTLSALVREFGAPGTFAELPLVARLDRELETYWMERGSDWSLLARLQFVRQARRARDDCSSASCALTQSQYRQIMTAAAPNVPLDGLVTLAQLRQDAPGNTSIRRFDINGYPSSDIVRFILGDKSEVLYVPGHQPSLLVFQNEAKLREWVFEQARDPKTLDSLLSHFSIYNAQDSVLWTGVRHGLEKLGKGEWSADADSIDYKDAIVAGDVFEDMRAQTESRLRDDARMRTSTAWEAWRATINRTATLLGPLGYVPALAIPIQTSTALVQAGTGIEQAVDGRTEDERKQGVEQAGMVAVTTPISAPAFAGFKTGNAGTGTGDAVEYETTGGPEGTAASQPKGFVPLREVNGKVGYPMSPTRPPRLPISRFYLRPDGSIARFLEADVVRFTRLQLPSGAWPNVRGIIQARGGTFVRWLNAPHARGARVIVGDNDVRLDVSAGGERLAGPVLSRQADGTWDFATVEQNDVKGSVMDRLLETDRGANPRAPGDPIFADDMRLTRHAPTIHRAAGILEELGSTEGELREIDHITHSPVAMLTLAHAFLETLPKRLRDTTSTEWSEMEVRVIAPLLAEHIRRPIAFFRGDVFDYTAFPDGHIEDASPRSAGAPAAIPRPLRTPPDAALDLSLIDGRYRSFDHTGFPRSHDLIGAALWGNRTEGPAVGDVNPEEVRSLRNAMAASLDTRSTLPELQRIHAAWFPGRPRTWSALWKISLLRHALFDSAQRLSAEQLEAFNNATGGTLASAFEPSVSDDDRTNFVNAALSHVIMLESALLPETLSHLAVTDPEVLTSRNRWEGDALIFRQRRYVRLRDLYGRTQVVETTLPGVGSRRAIRIPGTDLASGITSYEVFAAGGRWYPTTSPMARRPAMSAILGFPLPDSDASRGD